MLAFDQQSGDPFGDIPITQPPRTPSRAPMLGQQAPLVGPPRQAPPWAPPTGYTGTPDSLHPTPGGPADNTALPPPPSGFRYKADGSLERIPGGPLPNVDQAAEGAIRRGNIEAASQRLLDVGHMYREQYQPNTYGPISSIAESINLGPLTPTNQAFNAAAQGLVDAGMPIFRTPGIGSQSNLEGEWFNNANRLRASNADQTNETILDNLQNRLNAQRRQLGMPEIDWRNQQDQQPPTPGQLAAGQAGAGAQNGGAGPSAPGSGASPSGGPPAPPQGMDRSSQTMMNPTQTQTQLGDGATRLEEDPVLHGVANHVGAMVARGVPDDQILQYMRQAGVDPASTNAAAVLAFRRTPAFHQWQAQHPRTAYPMDRTFYTREVPQTAVRRTMASIANSPVGAYAANAGDAVTFGTLDNMTNDPAQARAGMEALRGQYPGASLAGSITGQALGAGGMELGAAGLGARGVMAARAADALGGAAYGAGSADDGSRLLGAAEGAGTSMLTGGAGRVVQRGAGRVLTGARDAATQALTARGIPLTLGQMAGQGGVIGRTVRGLEDKLQSVPLLGDAIRARREAGVQGFNRAAFDEALAPIGQSTAGTIAEQGVDAARDATTGGYRTALDGVNIDLNADPHIARDLTRALGNGQRLPSTMAEQFRATIENQVAPYLTNGTLTGEAYQAIRQGLRQDRAAMRGQPGGRYYDRAVRDVEGSLEAMVRRQAPEVIPALNRADQAFRQSRVVENAVAAGQNAGGVFTPAQLGQSARANARRFGGNQATTERPFFDLQRQAQDVLPSTVPNSGTADRAMAAALIPAATGAAAYEMDYLSPQNAALLGAFGLPYTRAGARALQTLIAHRPAIVRRAGEALIARQRIGGTLARGSAIPLLQNYSGQ